MPHPLLPELEQLARCIGKTESIVVQSVQVLTHRIPMTLQVKVQRTDHREVNLDDCAAFSVVLEDALESSGLLDVAYVLEVSSPGLGDELHSDKDFISFRSFPVQVYKRTISGVEEVQEGLLLSRDQETVRLNIRGRIVAIPRPDVLRVQLFTPT